MKWAVVVVVGRGRARLLGFIWQTRNYGQNWIRKPDPLFRCTREKEKKQKKNTQKIIIPTGK